LLHGMLRGSGLALQRTHFRVFDPDDQPVRFRQPLDARASRAFAAIEFRIDLEFSTLDLIPDNFGIEAKQVGKQVQIRFEQETVGREAVFPLHVHLEDPTRPVGNKDWLFQQIKKTCDQTRWDCLIAWQLDDGTASQLTLLRTLVRFRHSGEFHLNH
jgi:hypothetical protein